MPKRGPFWHPSSLNIQSSIAAEFLRGMVAFALSAYVLSIGRDDFRHRACCSDGVERTQPLLIIGWGGTRLDLLRLNLVLLGPHDLPSAIPILTFHVVGLSVVEVDIEF